MGLQYSKDWVTGLIKVRAWKHERPGWVLGKDWIGLPGDAGWGCRKNQGVPMGQNCKDLWC